MDVGRDVARCGRCVVGFGRNDVSVWRDCVFCGEEETERKIEEETKRMIEEETKQM